MIAVLSGAKQKAGLETYRTGGQGYHNGKQIEFANKAHWHNHCITCVTKMVLLVDRFKDYTCIIKP
jgi:hypothetical protein